MQVSDVADLVNGYQANRAAFSRCVIFGFSTPVVRPFRTSFSNSQICFRSLYRMFSLTTAVQEHSRHMCIVPSRYTNHSRLCSLTFVAVYDANVYKELRMLDFWFPLSSFVLTFRVCSPLCWSSPPPLCCWLLAVEPDDLLVESPSFRFHFTFIFCSCARARVFLDIIVIIYHS